MRSNELRGQVYGSVKQYVIRLRYFLPANGIAPRNEGVGVGRRYLDSSGHTIHAAAAGSVVKVKLTIQTTQTLLYFALDNPMPAGLDPIDESLNTSQQGLVKPPQHFPYDSTPDLTWSLVHSDLRDDRVSLYSSYPPPGRYTYAYLAEASTPDRYDVAPSHGSESLFREVIGRGADQIFTVR